uniref:Chitin synthase A n=1 Tax=Ganoderma boninense TaxID=34458 RepID=A0A5K1JZ24_9APHY|nr:Chitin synthase A [Ganoderma boninense]
MSDATRKAALQFLKGAADSAKAKAAFFLPQHNEAVLTWEFSDVELTVTKESYSQAVPTNITYKLDLGSLMPKKTKQSSDDSEPEPLVVYVLYPKEEDDAANKAAYKGCLDDLIANKDAYTSQRTA